MGFKTKSRLYKYNKSRYAIRNVIKKDIYKIIREFEKFEKLPYERKRPKHEPTNSYFSLSIQLPKCMMRDDALNWHDYGSYTEMNYLSSTVCSTDED